jgi:hypothetical protein
MSTNQITWSKPTGNQAFGKSYTRQAIAAPGAIKDVVDVAISAFVNNNIFGIHQDICQKIVSSFNTLEGVDGQFAHQGHTITPAKMTHIGGQSEKAFSKLFPTYGQRAMAFGALAMVIEQHLQSAGAINGLVYGVFTEFSNTNWADVSKAGFSKQSVQSNTYNVYRLWITPVGSNGAALSPSALYGYKVQQQAQAPAQAPAISVQQQGWGAPAPSGDDNPF